MKTKIRLSERLSGPIKWALRSLLPPLYRLTLSPTLSIPFRLLFWSLVIGHWSLLPASAQRQSVPRATTPLTTNGSSAPLKFSSQFTVSPSNTVAVASGASVSNLTFNGTNIIFAASRPSLVWTNTAAGTWFEIYMQAGGNLQFFHKYFNADVMSIGVKGVDIVNLRVVSHLDINTNLSSSIYSLNDGEMDFIALSNFVWGNDNPPTGAAYLTSLNASQFHVVPPQTNENSLSVNGDVSALSLTIAGASYFGDVLTAGSAINAGVNEIDCGPVFASGSISAPDATFNILAINDTLSAATNLASYATSSNPTNSHTTGILYTNAPQRSLLVGAAVLNVAGSGAANITLLYTNDGIGYRLPMQAGSGTNRTDMIPFGGIPLSPNAVYTFIGTMGTGASGALTNVVLWRQ